MFLLLVEPTGEGINMDKLSKDLTFLYTFDSSWNYMKLRKHQSLQALTAKHHLARELLKLRIWWLMNCTYMMN
jgi:hypothetical protein